MVPLAKAADKTGTENKVSKSKDFQFWLPFLYNILEKSHNSAIVAPITFA